MIVPKIVMVRETKVLKADEVAKWPWEMSEEGFDLLNKQFPGQYAIVSDPLPSKIVIPAKKKEGVEVVKIPILSDKLIDKTYKTKAKFKKRS